MVNEFSHWIPAFAGMTMMVFWIRWSDSANIAVNGGGANDYSPLQIETT